jgi:hypothetical protein
VITWWEKESLLRRIRGANRKFLRGRSSLRATLDALDVYRNNPTAGNLTGIQDRVDNLLTVKAQKCAVPLAYLAELILRESRNINEGRLENNDFRVSSSLKTYADTFGPKFVEKLNRLGGGSRWLDAGAGEAAAMISYLKDGGKAECLAIGFQQPQKQEIENAKETYNRRFRYVSGKYFGDMSEEDLGLDRGGFDLITDLNGVLYYTETVYEDVQRYLEILDVGGMLAVTNSDVRIEGFQSTDIAPLGAWLRKSLYVDFDEFRGSYLLVKTQDGAKPQPLNKLKFVTGTHNSPMRLFQTELNLN